MLVAAGLPALSCGRLETWVLRYPGLHAVAGNRLAALDTVGWLSVWGGCSRCGRSIISLQLGGHDYYQRRIATAELHGSRACACS